MTDIEGSESDSKEIEVVRLRVAASGDVAFSGDYTAQLTIIENKIAGSGSVAQSGALEVLRLRTPASGSLVLSGNVPVPTWREKIYPQSGAGIMLSGGGIESYSPWVTVAQPTQKFETIKIHAAIREPDTGHTIQIGQSGQTNVDEKYIQTNQSGTVLIDTWNPGRRYDANVPISARKKCEQGSGMVMVLKLTTREPS